MLKTLGIIVIGDEILNGMVIDCNSVFFTQKLRLSSIRVSKIAVIPDDIDEIAQEVRVFSERFDYVFTSGGIGPTHDDVTIDGIAKAFNVEVVIDEALENVLKGLYNDKLTVEALKMASVPKGAALITDDTIRFPLIQYRNIFIFPGIPRYLKEKFYVIEKMFESGTVFFKKVFLTEYESRIAPFLNEVVRSHKDVKIGSYPVLDDSRYRVVLTFEALDRGRIESAVAMLKESPIRSSIVEAV
ncbi:molybdopterin binding domain-containing protein [Candidatus Magnetoovum chiemensis]|nr:molybdopterin binding domain-containing protein [Candidatus Magnetoovum chiemensis]